MSEEGTSQMESSENGTDVSQDDTTGGGRGEEEAHGDDAMLLSCQTSLNLVPFVGQRFVSQDAAYEFYCSFAKQSGFSIRRHRTRGKDGVGRGVTRRDFTCHRGGYPQMKNSEENGGGGGGGGGGKMQRNRKSLRCGCEAYMRLVKRADFDVPEWRVTGFSNIHNHELLKSNEVSLLPAYSAISPDDKSRICMFAKAGMSVRQMLRLMELEKGLKLGCLPFTEVDVRNLLQSYRNVSRDNDVVDLLGMCKRMKDEDHRFKYEFKIDGNNRLEHVAWSYASSIQSYEAFGDAVVFDTTHRVEAYDMLLGIWLGVDNHGMICFFSCVLLRDDNAQSFSWALKAFISFMNGKAPQTILTDQNVWLKEAIAVEMPETRHAFCIWHIVAKFSDWFSVLLGPCYDEWKAEFIRLFNLEFVEDFEEGWREMVNKYRLHSSKHISSLHALRMFWALPFLRHHFFAGMTSTCQSESINGFIQRFLSAQSQLDCFVERAFDVVASNDKPEMRRKVQKVFLKTGSPIESHAAAVLTPYAFQKLQDELVLAPQYASFPLDEYCFQVRHHTEMNGGWKVIFDPCQEHISCSCNQFDFSGFLCRHVLRVLSSSNCFHIPDQYLPNRWRVNAMSSTVHSERIQYLQSMTSELVEESSETEERLEVACEQISSVLAHIKELPRRGQEEENAYSCPSDSLIIPEVEDADGIVHTFTIGTHDHDSISLGKLKERRARDGFELSRKRRHCSGPCCGQFGHDASECPIMGGDHLNGGELGYL